MNEALSQLSQLFAPNISPDSIPRYLSAAGISRHNLDLSGSPANVWFGILEEAQKLGKVANLVKAIHEDYPQGPIFAQSNQLLEAYQKANKPTPSASSTDTPQESIQAIRLSPMGSTGDLDDAAAQMLKLTRELESLKRMENDVIALSGRISSLQRKEIGGGLRSDEVERQTNVLRNALLGTLDRLEKRLSL